MSKRGKRSDKIISTENDQTSDNIILTLRTKGLNLPPKEEPSMFEINDDTDTEESSNDGIFYDDLPCETCDECIKKDLIISQYRDKLKDARKESDAYKLYTIPNPPVTKGNVLIKTDIDCWYHGRSHDHLACPLIDSRAGDTWFSIGSFCSPNCALGYNFSVINDSRVYERMSLTKQWIRKVCNIPITTPLKIEAAENVALLTHRGGKMSIEEFQSGFYFLEKGKAPLTKGKNITIDNRKHEPEMTDHSGLVLFRSKPLRKPKSILMVMGQK